MTRRGFFEWAGKSVAGAGALWALSNLEAIPALATELKENMDFKRGIEALMKDVFENNRETSAMMYSGKKGKIGAWHQPVEGDKRGVRVSEQDFMRALKKILHEQHVDIIGEAHTHPLYSFYLEGAAEQLFSDREMNEMREGKRPLPTMPPSIPDTGRHEEICFRLLQKRAIGDYTKFVSMVVDSRGVWYYQIEAEHYNQMQKKKAIVQQTIDMLAQKVEPLSQEEIDKLFADLAKHHGPLQTTENPLNEQSKRSKIIEFLITDEQAAVENFFTTQEELELYQKGRKVQNELDFLTQKRNEQVSLFILKALKEGELAKEDYDNLIEMYKQQGIWLTFQSYQELGLSYKNLHK